MTGRSNQPTSALLDETADCACLSLRGAARSVTQMYDEILKPSGLKSTQFSVLATVAMRGPANMTVIARSLVLDRTTLTRNLKPLLDRRLAQAGKSEDRRQRTITLTTDGKAALAKALPLWKRANDQIVSGIGYARWRGMASLLEETIRLSK